MSEVPLQAIARIPGLLIRLGFSALKMKRKAKVSAKKLRKSMIKSGMNKEMANKLASRYEEGLSIRSLMKKTMGEAGFSSIPFKF